MVLEALTKIQEAEKEAKQLKEDAKIQMSQYEDEKLALINEKKESAQILLQSSLEKQAAEYERILDEEHESATAQIKKEKEEMHQRFHNNKEELVNLIIERVSKGYGS